jgi:hypothetical protein
MARTMTELKSRYIREKEDALKEVHARFLVEILDMRKTCEHSPGVTHLTGVGTRIVLCKNCGDVMNEHIV